MKDSPSLPAEQFDRYRIENVLGRGGMGVVYLATDERLARKVALKVLSEYELPDAERRARFLREARAAAAIRHPNVATIYEVGEGSAGSPYIAMEYCEGSLLSELVPRGLETSRWIFIARQIAEGIAAAHRNGILHRDIKSPNIIVERDGRVKILDFGLAKNVDAPQDGVSLTSTVGHFFGTLPYMSPEQARGNPASAKSDLFSLGVVLYEMASGRLPFDSESPLGLLEQIRSGPPAPLVAHAGDFPDEARAIIDRLLRKDPEERFENAEALLGALNDLVSTADTLRQTSVRETTTAVGRIPVRRRRALLAAAAVTILMILVVAGVFLTRRRQPAAAIPQQIRSVAVLPFENLSGVKAEDFLSIGLADALTTRLQQIPELQVRPTSSIVELGGEKAGAKAAADKLGVDGVLEGRFLTQGSTVRVNLQLTDSRTGYGVWAGSIDGQRGDLLHLIDTVSEKTVEALNRKLAASRGASQPRSSSPEAFEAYLHARALTGTLNPEHVSQQIASLRRAIELDPSFAAAHAELAIGLSLGRVRGFDIESFERAEWYAREAVRLDPSLPSAHMALAKTLVRTPDRFSESVRENLAALRLNPNETQALYSLVTYLVAIGDLKKIQCIGDRFVSTDPSSNDVKARGYWNVNAVDPDGAIRLAPVALSSPDTRLAGHDLLGIAYLLRGDLTLAAEQQRQARELAPTHYIPKSLQAMIAAARGERKAAIEAVRTFEPQGRSVHWAALRIALVYAKLGEKRQALEWLETAANLGNHNWYFLVKHPWLQSLQGEPRFRVVAARMKRDLDDVRSEVTDVYDTLCTTDALRAAAAQ